VTNKGIEDEGRNVKALASEELIAAADLDR
jgi:hypothetical protein